MLHARAQSKHARRYIRRSLASTAPFAANDYAPRSQSICLHSIVVRIGRFVFAVSKSVIMCGEEGKNSAHCMQYSQLLCSKFRKCEMVFYHRNGKLSFAYSHLFKCSIVSECSQIRLSCNGTNRVYGQIGSARQLRTLHRIFSSHSCKQLAKRVDLCMCAVFDGENERIVRKP